MDDLVSTAWLEEHMRDPDLRILDASWHMPADKRDAKAEFDNAHIPGAQFFDIDDISDQLSPLPHMAPGVEKFLSRVRKLGIADGTKIVIYDSTGIFSAPRVWWMFRLFGKDDVAVLDGGLPKWILEERPISSNKRAPRDRHLTLKRRGEKVKNVSEVAQASKLGQAVILDARAPERFRGEIAEPREGLRAGHIPNSKNLFFKEVLNSDQTFKNPDDLRALFAAKGIDENTQVITSCGSGITAAVLSLGLNVAGFTNHALYDGSWTEWGQMELLDIETGEER